jgi:hypothetical protein
MLVLQLASFIQNLVFRTGLDYLIVRWYGEHRDRLAFRRPARLLASYALFLLVWQIAQIRLTEAPRGGCASASGLVRAGPNRMHVSTGEQKLRETLRFPGVFYAIEH